MTFITFLAQAFVIITLIAFVSKVISALRTSMRKSKLIDELERKRDELTMRRKDVVEHLRRAQDENDQSTIYTIERHLEEIDKKVDDTTEYLNHVRKGPVARKKD